MSRYLLVICTFGLLSPLLGAEPVNLLKLPLHDTFAQHLNEKASLETDFQAVWDQDENGHLHITGKGLGYLYTKASFQDYHLVVEYRWSEQTFAGRSDRARDGGVLFHITGSPGAFGGTWPACLQAALIEGGSGGLICLPTNDVGATFTGTATLQDPPLWNPDGANYRFPRPDKKTGHLGWKDRSENWKDVKGFRGELDIENPVGEWNRLEVIANGDTVAIHLNGELINRATKVFPSGGQIGFQTELAAYEVRRMEVFELGSFREKWAEEARSTDMGYAITGESILPRRLPLSPEASRQLWKIDGDYEIELVAAEPLTCDPVDVIWDADGRMFVAEMGDYPLPVDDGFFLSRIRLLHDRNGDGVMDAATTWADNLDHVQGLLPLRDGILATTRTSILFLRDTDGDNKADERKVLFRSNEPRHNQLQISSPRWGLDNRIYFSNGLDGKQIYPADDPDKVTEFSRLNLVYDPYTNSISPSTGVGQYGGTIDSFGRHFFCSNRNPAIFAVMPLEAVRRNPLSGITAGHEDIQPQAAPVSPVSLSHTTSSAHAGTHTAACGLGIYSGDLLESLTGDLFVCDPTAQLVTRNKISLKGASFTAERVGETREFLASADEWARPVQVRNGPDGALYVVDMYRRFIDHARFFPEDFAKAHYMRSGLDQGRIWRIVPKGKKTRSIDALPEETGDLIALLAHPNDWHRRQAQRLIVEKGDSSIAPELSKRLDESSSPEEMVRYLWTLSGLGALTEEHLGIAIRSLHPAVVENGLLAAHQNGMREQISKSISELTNGLFPRAQFLSICLFPEIERDPDKIAEAVFRSPTDPWLRKAILSSEGESAPKVLERLVSSEKFHRLPPFVSMPSEEASGAISDFSRYTASLGDLDSISRMLQSFEPDPVWWHFEVLSGISEGLKKSSLREKTLGALIANDSPKFRDGAAVIKRLLDDASRIALDSQSSEADRTAALDLVAQRSLEEKLPIVEKLIAVSESPAIQTAACRILSRDNREKVADFFFSSWDQLAPIPRREALALITANTKTGLALMKRMDAGEISSNLMPPMTRWSYGRSSNEEIKTLALKLFGETASDRGDLVSRYRLEMAALTGDATNGALVFQRAACVTCHQVGEQGVLVGPSLNDVKAKPDEAILTDILDPNRALEERWIASTVETAEGTQFTGILFAEDATGVTVKTPGGAEQVIPRATIQRIHNSGLSLMPLGLEAAIPAQDMADLIAFLKKRD